MARGPRNFLEVVAGAFGFQPRDRFQAILREGANKNIAPARAQQARTWYRNRAEKIKTIDEDEYFRDSSRIADRLEPGYMYMYKYFPKYIDELPYHDRLPLVFPIEPINNGILGMNMHYLPLPMRAVFMDALYSLASDDNFDDETKLRITYEILKSATRYRFFKPCIKKYLFTQLRSDFIKINSYEWDIALFLPFERFAIKQGAISERAKFEAQADSIGKIN